MIYWKSNKCEMKSLMLKIFREIVSGGYISRITFHGSSFTIVKKYMKIQFSPDRKNKFHKNGQILPQ